MHVIEVKTSWVGLGKSATRNIEHALNEADERSSKRQQVGRCMPDQLSKTLSDVIFKTEKDISELTVAAGLLELPEKEISTFPVLMNGM